MMDVQDLPRRCHVGKLGVSIVNMDRVLSLVAEQVRRTLPAYICVTNVDATLLSQRDLEFCAIQNQSFLAVPDGMPLIWYARMMGERTIQRVTGPDLMIELLRLSGPCGYTHYFYGDTDETLDRIRRVILDQFPGARILGMHSPPFHPPTAGEIDAAVTEINRLRPSFVWVGLGCPKQERWMARVFPRIESSILIGVGAAFRFLAGDYHHPPKIVQICGLEGIFWRALRRPGYVAKWYACHVPAFGLVFLRGCAKRLLMTWRGADAS